jgi:hypothetical protein
MEPRLPHGWTLLDPRKETLYRFEGRYWANYPPVSLDLPQDVCDVGYCLARIPHIKSRSGANFSDGTLNRAVGMTNATEDLTTIESLPGELIAVILEQDILS